MYYLHGIKQRRGGIHKKIRKKISYIFLFFSHPQVEIAASLMVTVDRQAEVTVP